MATLTQHIQNLFNRILYQLITSLCQSLKHKGAYKLLETSSVGSVR